MDAGTRTRSSIRGGFAQRVLLLLAAVAAAGALTAALAASAEGDIISQPYSGDTTLEGQFKIDRSIPDGTTIEWDLWFNSPWQGWFPVNGQNAAFGTDAFVVGPKSRQMNVTLGTNLLGGAYHLRMEARPPWFKIGFNSIIYRLEYPNSSSPNPADYVGTGGGVGCGGIRSPLVTRTFVLQFQRQFENPEVDESCKFILIEDQVRRRWSTSLAFPAEPAVFTAGSTKKTVKAGRPIRIPVSCPGHCEFDLKVKVGNKSVGKLKPASAHAFEKNLTVKLPRKVVTKIKKGLKKKKKAKLTVTTKDKNGKDLMRELQFR